MAKRYRLRIVHGGADEDTIEAVMIVDGQGLLVGLSLDDACELIDALEEELAKRGVESRDPQPDPAAN